MTEIITRCPQCKMTFQISDEWLGKEIICSQCEKSFVAEDQYDIKILKKLDIVRTLTKAGTLFCIFVFLFLFLAIPIFVNFEKIGIALYFVMVCCSFLFSGGLLYLGVTWARGIYRNLLQSRTDLRIIRENIEKK